MTYDTATWFDAVTTQTPAIREELQKRRIRSWDAYFAQIRTGGEPVLWLRDASGDAITLPEVAQALAAPSVVAPVPSAVPPAVDALNARLRADYERGLSPKERLAKINAIRHLFELGDPNGSMSAYARTVPGLVSAVMAERFEGTPIPEVPEPPEARWVAPTARAMRAPARWSEPVPVAIPSPITVDAAAVDALFAGLS